MTDTLTLDAPPVAEWWPEARQGTVTLSEYFDLPEGTPFEFWDGTLVHRVTGWEVHTLDAVHDYLSRYGTTPSPNFFHQITLRNLFRRFDAFVVEHDLGEVLFAPFDVLLEFDGETKTVEPDLLFISNARMGQLRDKKRLYGPPDLVVEILSPSNAHHDLIRKRDLYEAAGVSEYWIVDPKVQRVDVFVQGEDGFALDQRTEGRVASRILDGLTMDVSGLFE